MKPWLKHAPQFNACSIGYNTNGCIDSLRIGYGPLGGWRWCGEKEDCPTNGCRPRNAREHVHKGGMGLPCAHKGFNQAIAVGQFWAILLEVSKGFGTQSNK